MRRQAVVEKEWVLKKQIENFVMDEVWQLDYQQASQLVALFKRGCESAYIARYREDIHRGLKPEAIRNAVDAYHSAIDLNKKVSGALNSVISKVEGLDEKKVVEDRLRHCEDSQEVTEISKEFVTRTIKTKAAIAREFGLEEPARAILNGERVNFDSFISNNLKTVSLVKENLKICLADLINNDPQVLKSALSVGRFDADCKIRVKTKLSREASKKQEHPDMEQPLRKYRDLLERNDWSAKTIRDHTVSAMNRGTEEGILTWSVDVPVGEATNLHPFKRKRVHSDMQSFFDESLRYSIATYFIPRVERIAKKFLVERASNRSIELFGRNVEQLFNQKGLQRKYVIALDPGHIIKTAFLKPCGSVIAMDQFRIREDVFDNKGTALLKKWAQQTKGRDLVFAIGNGSNTYNTQKAVSQMIEFGDFPEDIDVSFCLVPEHGASKYSCTEAAREEFGEDADIKQISAVSIGRRLIDPMSEYVKIEPQHLGKGQYQQSVNEKLLKSKLEMVVRDRVSLIGADLNKASKPLLQHICGLNKTTASNIVKYREENGEFRSRAELRNVKGIGDVAFQQCAGFLTVSNPEGSSQDSGPPSKRLKSQKPQWCPLDETMVHPEDYTIAQELLKKLGTTVEKIADGTQVPHKNLTSQEERIIHLLTLKPELKPPPQTVKKVRALKDLAPNQRFTGTVTNTTDFGVFVDIGVEKDGLVHISHFPRAHSNQRNGKDRRDKESRNDDDEPDLPKVGDTIEVIIDAIKFGKISLRPVL